MEDFTLSSDRILAMDEKHGIEARNMVRFESSGLWKRLYHVLKANFSAPFESDWEKKTGLHWKEWGKM